MWPFKKKAKKVQMIATFGKLCPKCNVDGLFKNKKEDGSIYYRCEECLTSLTEEEYQNLKKDETII